MAEVFVRGLVMVILLSVAAFCAFGFLATFEPPGWPVLRVAYAVGVAGCLAGAARVALRRRGA